MVEGGSMPSGLTHMIISRQVMDDVANSGNLDVHALLTNLIGPYILGCVSPDLPYMTLMDANIFTHRKIVADDLHYKKTNQVPLQGLQHAKRLAESGNDEEARVLFSFYAGYCSHLIADGIIHPFVRDKVGDYKVAATDHRILEMKLDVLVAERLLGLDANKISFHEELDWIKDCKSKDVLFKSFSEMIKSVHGHDVKPDEIKSWINVMDFVFDTVTGHFPVWYQKLLGDNGAALQDFNTLRKSSGEILNLKLPVDAEKHGLKENYLRKENVNFFEDVLPKYRDYFSKFVAKAYDHVFNDGPDIDYLLPEIDLDTGRLIAKSGLENKPGILEVTV